MSPAASSNAETVVAERQAIKEKKQRRRQQKAAKPAPEKLFEKLGKCFVDEMASLTYQTESVNLSEALNPSETSKAQQSTTTTRITTVETTTTTTSSTEQTEPTSNSTGKQSRISHENQPLKPKYRKGGNVFTLDDLSALGAVEGLIDRYGKVSHMGILDKSYSFFVTKHRDTALYFKVSDKVAVVGGDPLCEPDKYDEVLAEFAEYRKQFNWGIAFLGATSTFATYAQSKKWVTMQFGIERVLNPMTNSLLLETGGGKRIIAQNKQLIRQNITLGIYSSTHRLDHTLQNQLMTIYETWCDRRNEQLTVQAYLTLYNPFALPEIMTYIYAKDADGHPCGFAALRKIVNGYHIDPCIALPGAPRGITELLIFSAMSLLHQAGISYLSLGFEPSVELGEITNIPKPIQALTRSVHRRTYRSLPIGGKRAFHDKFKPDQDQQGDLYLVLPGRALGWKHIKAIMHIMHVRISRLIVADVKRSLSCWSRGRSGNRKAGKGDEVAC